jgi:hypothetical protein
MSVHGVEGLIAYQLSKMKGKGGGGSSPKCGEGTPSYWAVWELAQPYLPQVAYV